ARQRYRERDQDQTEDRGHQPRGEVARADDLVDEGVQIVEERSVIRRVVSPVPALRQRIRLVRVDRLVVVERPVAERPEPRKERHRSDRRQEEQEARRPRRAVGSGNPAFAQGVLLSARETRETEALPVLTTYRIRFFRSTAIPVGFWNFVPASSAPMRL